MKDRGFTIVELLVVMVIILVLAGLLLATSSYVHNKGARSRTEAEIAAISAALESYKADNGTYPSSPNLNPTKASSDATTYQSASSALYQALTGDSDGDGQPDQNAKSYMSFKSSQIGKSATPYIKDPFGNSYGYSTAGGYNPTFDLWSTAGATSGANRVAWIKNW